MSKTEIERVGGPDERVLDRFLELARSVVDIREIGVDRIRTRGANCYRISYLRLYGETNDRHSAV